MLPDHRYVNTPQPYHHKAESLAKERKITKPAFLEMALII